ncbi:hypothetical protein B0J12DRAFT_755322 [Macrophomina phaseolina]|uniref:Cupin type-1 domain-containing protein n=1 Tax=Macrophomina phaseolina TaxID=35725 RepID=A0ABQ8G947_9PEZI|nr:hypothetical protein B0J12DRAFT_755322 [Macrophomina phaseolina]
MASLTIREPETYSVRRNAHCPNSSFPVLVYRNVLPTPVDEESTSEFLQHNKWEKKGTWGAIMTKHFHPNTHECYGIFRGTSTLVFGEGGLDAPGTGVRCTVSAGDVVVVPAGVAHASATSADDYKYIGVYPQGSPKWRNEWGKRAVEDDDPLLSEIAAVPVPACDPVYGAGGPAVRIWREIRPE